TALERLINADPNDRALSGGRAFILNRIARYQLEDGKPNEALETARQALDFNIRIAAADPSDAAMGWNVVNSKLLIGDILVALNRRDEARASYSQAWELSESFGSKIVASNQQETKKSLKEKLAALDAPVTRPATAPAEATR